MKFKYFTALFLVPLLLTGCFEAKQEILPGKRVQILDRNKVDVKEQHKNQKVKLQAAHKNNFWKTIGKNPSHDQEHLAFVGFKKQLWRVRIGQGSARDAELLTQPIILDGLIYTLDAHALLQARKLEDGKLVWQKSLKPKGEGAGFAHGGLTFFKGKIFVATGFSQVHCLSKSNGESFWMKQLSAPVRAAPVCTDNVYVLTNDNTLHALSPDTGEHNWQHRGVSEPMNMLRGAAPGVSGDGFVLAGHSSGEIVSVRGNSGDLLWSDSLAQAKTASSVYKVPSIRDAIVVKGNYAYAASHSGRMACFDVPSGMIVWEDTSDGNSGPTVVGSYLYVVDQQKRLNCFNRQSGKLFWTVALQKFENEKKKEDPVLWTTPLVAGNQVILGNSLKQLVVYSAESGEKIHSIKLSAPLKITPIVAHGKVFVLTDNGQLSAWGA